VKTIILGARGSQLALAQAELAKQAVERLPGVPGFRVAGSSAGMKPTKEVT
jgi:porphobilinogen deaminase